MFRAAAPGPYDEGVAKATDENMTNEDWGAIMDLVDRASKDPNGAQQAVQAIIKRLAHRNANVQLYTLELANALSQNCDKPMWRELASRAFTDALLKLANDRNTHAQVKAKIFERMKEWSDMFNKDPDLGIMHDAYYRLKQTNPQLEPPSAPQKDRLTDVDRQKEEDELQMALNLSLQEEERKKAAQAPPSTNNAGPSASSNLGATGAQNASTRPQIRPMPSGVTAATVSRVRALYDFAPSEPGELEFKKGDVIAVLESVYKDWWRGSLKGKTGIFPLNYVEKLTDPTPEELERESQMEAEVFAEIKNVEKLLTLLSTNSAPREEDNEEISKLYHQTLAIRPKLINLIEKYSQKKDDFTQLNEKFIKARRDYEALLEASMSQPPQPSYQQYALRPAGTPSYGPGRPQSQAYPPQGQQEPGRYYTPGPGQDQRSSYHPQSTPSPNYQRPSGGMPAPFYVAGAQVQPDHGVQTQYPPQQYAQHDYAASSGPSQTTHVQTSSTQQQQHNAYSRPSLPHDQRPSGTYGNPQELATSVYDSPIATHNPQSAVTYSSSVYSPEDPYGASSPTGPAPESHAPPTHPGYTYTGQQQPGVSPPQPSQHSYDAPSSETDHEAPPQPSNYPPPIPGSQYGGRPDDSSMSAQPARSGGGGYPQHDARQRLPSQMGSQPVSGVPPAAVGAAAQYKPYTPPQQGNEPSAPNDYYRQSAY